MSCLDKAVKWKRMQFYMKPGKNKVNVMRAYPGMKALVLLLVLGVFSGTGHADQEDTFRPYVRGLYGYDSNLFRLQNEEEAMAVLGTTDTAESYRTLAAGMDVNLRVSRQAFKVHGEVNQTRFNQYSNLDYQGRNVFLKWDWVVGNAAKGNLGVSETLTQASYTNVKKPVSNLIRVRRNFFDGAFKMGSAWQAMLGLEQLNVNNNAAILQTQDATVDSVDAGVQYTTSKGSKIRWITLRSEGKYPNRQVVTMAPVDNGYRQWDNGVAGSWILTDKTLLSGRLNHTRRSYRDVPQRNFSGLTGLLSADWAVSDKTTLRALVHRDIGAIENDTASYSLNQGLAFGAEWSPTVKLAFNTQLSHDNIAYTGDPGFVLTTAPARHDRLTTLQAGVNYSVLRNTKIGLVLQRGIRNSNEGFSGYAYNSALINLRSEF